MILVLDYGTTALKVAVYDEDFNTAHTCSREWKYSYPAPGLIEYPVEEYWEETLLAVKALKERMGSFKEIRAVSVTGQAETMILLDANNNPLGNAIVWLDGRPVEQCTQMSRSYSANRFYAQTGNTEFHVNLPLLKLQWLKKQEPDRSAKISKVLLLKDYIVYRLTKALVTEHTINCCSGYFDIVKKDWSDELLEACGLKRSQLPILAPANARIGEISACAAREMDLPRDTVVINGLLDQCASAIGAGNIRAGKVSATIGTVLAVAATLEEFRPEELTQPVLMFCHTVEGKYLALPNCPTAGVLLSWFKNEFLFENEGGFDRINKEVYRRLNKPSELILLPHFSGRLSPVVNSNARGVLYGLTLGCDKYDVARSIMESVAYLLRENLELLEQNHIFAEEITSLGGGAKSEVWQQIMADVCAREMIPLKEEESTSLGCAINAAMALGTLKQEDIPSLVRPRKVYSPTGARKEYYDEKYQKYKELNAKLGYDKPL